MKADPSGTSGAGFFTHRAVTVREHTCFEGWFVSYPLALGVAWGETACFDRLVGL